MLPAWSESVKNLENTVIGVTEVDLINTSCSSEECNIGNLYCDAVVHAYLKDIPFERQLDWTDSAIAIGASADMRISIRKGPIKYSQVFELVPYNCDLMSFNLPGYELLAALEHSVKNIDLSNNIREAITFPQVAGIHVVYNLKAPPQQRVVKVSVRSTNGLIPKYEKLDYNKTYRIIATRFVARGGFDYKMFREHGSDFKGGRGNDTNIQDALLIWQTLLGEYGNQVFGSTYVYLQQKECAWAECNLGNFYTDAMVHAFLKIEPYNTLHWTNVSIAMTTQGNFRVPLYKGNLTYNHLISMCPWENKLIALTIKGHILKDILEDSVAPMLSTAVRPSSTRMLQVSGIKVTYNISKTIGQRIIDLKVRCQNCAIPIYEEIELDQDYHIVVMEYLANGKNGFHLLSENAKDLIIGPLDLDAFIDYMQSNEPITAGLEKRILILK